MRCYRRLLLISCIDHVTDEGVCRKIQAASGDSGLGQKMGTEETEVIWPHHKVFWLSEDSSAGYSGKKMRKG